MILNGGGDYQNWMALFMAVPFLVLGIVILVKREPIAKFMAATQSKFGPLGRRVAQENKPWVYFMVGAVFVLLSSLLIVLGLFVRFNPPGTPH